MRNHLKDRLCILALCALMFFPSVRAQAAPQYSLYNGICYNTELQALTAFLHQSLEYRFNDSAGNGYMRLYQISGVPPNATIVRNVYKMDNLGVASLLSTGSNLLTVFNGTYLLSCDPALDNGTNTVLSSFDPVVAGEMFAWAFGGIMLIGMMSWGIGSIVRFTYQILTKPGGGKE